MNFVHRAKENEGTKKLAPPPPAELIEIGFEDEYYKQREEEWQREGEARKLPELNLETAVEWAGALKNQVMVYVYEFGIRKL